MFRNRSSGGLLPRAGAIGAARIAPPRPNVANATPQRDRWFGAGRAGVLRNLGLGLVAATAFFLLSVIFAATQCTAVASAGEPPTDHHHAHGEAGREATRGIGPSDAAAHAGFYRVHAWPAKRTPGENGLDHEDGAAPARDRVLSRYVGHETVLADRLRVASDGACAPPLLTSVERRAAPARRRLARAPPFSDAATRRAL